MPFIIQRGANISEWLSQSQRRGMERACFFTEADMRLITRLGFDHIRLPVDEEQLWDERGRRDPEAFSLLDAALDWAEQYGLRVIVDLHILRSHYFNSQSTPRLFTDPVETIRFAGLWADLSDFLGRRSNDRVGYELMNEAVARDARDWNRVAMAGLQAIRAREPERMVVLGSNWYNQVHTFDMLEVPQDPALMLTFHYYRPMLITHYRASWWPGGEYSGPVHYPGRTILPEDLQNTPPLLRQVILDEANDQDWSRERIEREIALPVAVARRAGCPLYCGEWGAIHTTPFPLRLAWYHDMLSLFKQYGIAWANWDYKGGFAPVVRDGQPSEIVDVLMAD